MSYTIDTVLVNDRIDWELIPLPMPATKRYEAYPGQPEQYAISGPAMPMDLQIKGTLQAANVAALLALVDTYARMDAAGTEHTLLINGATYAAMDLVSFRCSSTYYPISDAAGKKIAIDVVFHWRQLRREVVSA